MPDFAKSPLIALYVLDRSGIPLFARHYEGTLSEHEAVLLGGFFSAIEIFARSSLKSKLLDIGVEDKRFYFRNTMDRYIQIVVGNSKDSGFEESRIIKLLQERIQLALLIVTEVAELNNLDANQVIKGMGESFDSLVMECVFEEIDVSLEISREPIQGKSIDYTDFSFDEILDKITDLLD